MMPRSLSLKSGQPVIGIDNSVTTSLGRVVNVQMKIQGIPRLFGGESLGTRLAKG
jgi:hypothetical protein